MRRNQNGQAAFGVILGVIAAIVVAAVIVLVAWNVGWWFKTQNTNREAHVIRRGYSNQQTLREEISRKIGDVQQISVQIAELGKTDQATTKALVAQRKAIVGIVCQDAAQVTGDPLPPDQAQFTGANCAMGAISPNSQYNG